MTDDFLVKRRSDSEVRQIAKRARAYLGFANGGRVDVVACLRKETIWTVSGVKRLMVKVLPDIELGTADALTSHTEELILIAFKQSVYRAAVLGEGRARNTVAHELGHAVIHNRSMMPRRAGGNDKYRWLRPYESAEHQANVFAAAFLIDDDGAKSLDSAEKVSIQFGVSLKCAEIYYKEILERRDRGRAAEKMRKLASSFSAEVKHPHTHDLRFLASPCPKCGERKVFPVGSKYMCHHCDTVSDTFPDGDYSD